MSRTVLTYPDLPAGLLTQPAGDGRYLQLTGGSLSGDLHTDSDLYLDGYFTKLWLTSDGLLAYNNPADTQPSLRLVSVTGGGQLEFGPGGTGSTDTMLYRDGPGVLYAQTDLRVERAVMVGGYFQSGLGYGAPYPATTGTLRMRYGEAIAWRNSAASANLLLSIDASDNLLWQGFPLLAQPQTDALYVKFAGGAVMKGGLALATGWEGLYDLGTAANRWRVGYFAQSVVVKGSAATSMIRLSDAADTQERFVIDGSGQHYWGPGGGTVTDTSLARTAAARLSLVGSLWPNTDNAYSLGYATRRWQSIVAVNADFANPPTVGGTTLLTSITADALYVNVAGDQMTGPLALRVSGGTASARLFQAVPGARLDLTANMTYDGTNWNRDDTSKGGLTFTFDQDGWGVYSVAAGIGANPIAPASMKQRIGLAPSGMLTLYPDAGQSAPGLIIQSGATAQFNNVANSGSFDLSTRDDSPGTRLAFRFNGAEKLYFASTGGLVVTPDSAYGNGLQANGNIIAHNAETITADVRLGSAYGLPGVYSSTTACFQAESNVQVKSISGNIVLIGASWLVAQSGGGTGFIPNADNNQFLGYIANRWNQIYSSIATISTSHVSLKEHFAPLDGAACVEAVLGTDWLSFDYKPMPRAEDVSAERYAEMLAETEPGRKQKGYVLGSPDFRTSELFGQSDRYSASTHADLAVVACALQNALQRIAALEALEAARG